MAFYDKYVELCSERNLKPQGFEMLNATGVSSASINAWKNGSVPKGEVICRVADYFGVTTDYLLGRSKSKNFVLSSIDLSEKEQLLIEAYRAADALGQMKIIYTCMDEQIKAESKRKDSTSAS